MPVTATTARFRTDSKSSLTTAQDTQSESRGTAQYQRYTGAPQRNTIPTILIIPGPTVEVSFTTTTTKLVSVTVNRTNPGHAITDYIRHNKKLGHTKCAPVIALANLPIALPKYCTATQVQYGAATTFPAPDNNPNQSAAQTGFRTGSGLSDGRRYQQLD